MNGVYLKHNCFKSWSLLRLHLGCHEWSKEGKNEHLDRGESKELRKLGRCRKLGELKKLGAEAGAESSLVEVS